MMVMHAITGDITKFKSDAIVNAANSSLLGGGGVDGAIHRAGGPQILDACKKIVSKQGGCKTGNAVITTAGNLPAKFVIHTVGPVWKGGMSGEPALLDACYRNSLQLALDNNCRTVAFPSISTGVYGYPKNKAAAIAVNAVREFIQQHPDKLDVTFVCFDEENYNFINQQLA
jgi:O-acetyl-ADP-ribose deacetylase (regulator of RNase III)